MFRHQRIGGLGEPLERLPKFLQACISHGHSHVAQKARKPGPANRTMAKHFVEFLFGQLRQPAQWRSEVFRLKGARNRTASIPGAHVLTDVAAEYMVSDFGAVARGGSRAQLDCEVGNTEAGVLMGGRVRRGSVDGWGAGQCERSRTTRAGGVRD